jgi:hypothetical protein
VALADLCLTIAGEYRKNDVENAAAFYNEVGCCNFKSLLQAATGFALDTNI